MSMTVLNAVPISPCRANPGQVMNPVTRIPPSVVNALCSRDGAVAACAQRGPYQQNDVGPPRLSRLLSQFSSIRAAISGPRSGIASTIAPSAPLSDRKITTVSSSSPSQ